MPQFQYEALDSRGKTVRGIVNGATPNEAAAILKSRNLAITGLRQEGEEATTGRTLGSDDLLTTLSIVRQYDVVILLKQMVAMLRSGISLVATLNLLIGQTRRRKLRKILIEIKADVESGRFLSEAMTRFPRVFPPFVTSMVQVGETTGIIEDSLEQVVTLWEERISISRRIINTMIYPAIVLIAVPAAAAFLIWYVIPNLTPFIKSMGGELTWNVELLIAIADGFPSAAPKILIALVLLIAATAALHLLPGPRYYLDLLKLHLPLVGPIFQDAVVVHFTRTLSMLLDSGVPVLDCIRNVKDSTRNHAAKRVLQDMEQRIMQGEEISAPLLEATSTFPPVVGTSVRVGEETGSIHTSLAMISGMFAEMLEIRMNRLVALIEPAMILILGGMVAFVASSLVCAIIAAYGRFAM